MTTQSFFKHEYLKQLIASITENAKPSQDFIITAKGIVMDQFTGNESTPIQKHFVGLEKWDTK